LNLTPGFRDERYCRALRFTLRIFPETGLFFKPWQTVAKRIQLPAAPLRPDADLDTEKLALVARDLISMLYGAYSRGEDAPHPETVIGAVAALTGEFMLRATGLPLPKIGFVFDDQIDDMLYMSDEHMTIWNAIETVTAVTRLEAKDLPQPSALIQRVGCGVALAMQGEGKNFPPLSVPYENYPEEWSPNAGVRLRNSVFEIGRKHGCTRWQLAFALAYATVGIIRDAQEVLSPAIGVKLAAEILFATARMAPIEQPI
jgi:hypothetical protein